MPRTPTPPPLPERYRVLALLGEGGVGEVWRARDAVLEREVAVKVLHPDVSARPRAAARFANEARTIARLQHPSVIPIYDFGTASDGRAFYTMKEVQGSTLRDVLERDLPRGVQGGAAGGLHALVDALRRACEAVAFAHAAGILHRDLTPRNVMLGAFGEVVVLDWGLARTVQGAEIEEDGEEAPSSADRTQAGAISGTPAYLAPEQARGERLGPPVDVYGLGAILYEILSGRAPYGGSSAWAILAQLLQRPPPTLEERLGEIAQDPAISALCRVAERALARDPADRYPDAGALAEALSAWLAGAHRRSEALALVAQADALQPRIAALRAEAAALRERASSLLVGVKPHDPIDRKRPAWALEAEAARQEADARGAERAYARTLEVALHAVPDLPEAHARLADHYQARHAAAEARRDLAAAAEEEARLRQHDRGRWAEWLRGDGRLDLAADPPGAEVVLYRYEEEDRRLVPRLVRSLGRAPLADVPLPMGSYLLELRAPGRVTTRYPVSIGRQERWSGAPPGEDAPRPVPLPPAGALGEDEVYVPPGWFQMGGDAGCPTSLPAARLWVGGFLMRRFPVTNAEYIAFLNDLWAKGDETARKRAPRLHAGASGDAGALLIGFSEERGFFLDNRPDDPQPVLPDAAVVAINWHDATRYAAWRAERDGLPWRLPTEAEREKAARGVDGRFYPWGDLYDATWSHTRDSRPDHPSPSRIHEFPTDESPYGVRGLAGNVREWCSDPWGGPAGLCRVYKGASWLDAASVARAAGRAWTVPTDLFSRLGFRLVRAWPAD